MSIKHSCMRIFSYYNINTFLIFQDQIIRVLRTVKVYYSYRDLILAQGANTEAQVLPH